MDIVKSPLWPRSLLWTLSNHHSGPDQSYGHCQITTLAPIKAMGIVKSPLWPRSKLWALSNHHSGPDQSCGHCQITTLAQIKAMGIVKSPVKVESTRCCYQKLRERPTSPLTCQGRWYQTLLPEVWRVTHTTTHPSGYKVPDVVTRGLESSPYHHSPVRVEGTRRCYQRLGVGATLADHLCLTDHPVHDVLH